MPFLKDKGKHVTVALVATITWQQVSLQTSRSIYNKCDFEPTHKQRGSLRFIVDIRRPTQLFTHDDY